ncbi:4,5-DOPA-extradiol-dioxygenase [Chlorobium ferrooxidans]|uniref:Extradiol ring-cleavage dioxygenase, class III enzyme, subunit B n=1 Tax=Chlorobium ferrooxidans DSM 13031 TaxID=377431 RepID=Q0YRP9_9CHLB|nr:4,5-DOPA dioxygenase extradiol [Chlorobium ferrooxidans]EAT58964.1 Extradiol ring-cleavage dioxygenase, class III enzyme, subunit B [Chlorobium ferrooxidans DSM 13031]
MSMVMPAVFFGHGSPMNAMQSNRYSESWRRYGQTIPRPGAILAISAHWYLPESAVTASPHPETMHDFGGFPAELYSVTYPAPGSPGLARRVQQFLLPVAVRLDEQRGLDHGTWSLLAHIFPDGDIPVVQLSIDASMNPEFHFETGRRLQPLREEGVLILCSGNIVHNLAAYAWGDESVPPCEWALRFEHEARKLIIEGRGRELVDYRKMGEDARLSVPTPEHFLPLLYLLGLQREDEPPGFPVEGIEGGSLSMLSVSVGG